ncbi:MAG: CPBP family glutamic-type intramembrane protease [Candidatus Sericytochromatia bacterium]
MTFLTGSALLMYLAIHAGFVCFALAYIAVQVGLNQQSWHSLFRPGGRPWRMGAFWETLGVWMGLLLFATGLEVLIFPGSVVFKGLVPHWPLWLLAICFFTPLQVWAEESFFRVYLPSLFLRLFQFRGPISKLGIGLAIGLSACCFALVHLQNPELNTSAAWLVVGYYLLFATLAALLLLWEQGLERVLAWHMGTNLFAFLFLSYDLAAIRTPALFHSSRFDPAWNLAQFVLLSLLGCGILYLRKRREQLV